MKEIINHFSLKLDDGVWVHFQASVEQDFEKNYVKFIFPLKIKKHIFELVAKVMIQRAKVNNVRAGISTSVHRKTPTPHIWFDFSKIGEIDLGIFELTIV